MGALSSVISGINTVASVVGTVNSLANNIGSLADTSRNQDVKNLKAHQDLALKQLRMQQDLAQQTAEDNAALQKSQLAAQSASDDRQRQAALKRAVAAQRASFGAQGVGSGDGSSEAVLLGLFDESDDERKDRERLDILRSTALDQSISSGVNQDMLQLTQLQQRQKLERELLSSK